MDDTVGSGVVAGWKHQVLCARCIASGAVRAAWTYADGLALCIRHASEALNMDDDMNEAEALLSVYAKMRALGLDPY